MRILTLITVFLLAMPMGAQEKKSDSVVPTQQLRQEQWDDWRFTYDHVMLVYGKALDEKGEPYYMVKNSWGDYGPYKGTWYMSRDFMAQNTVYLFLNRHALPKALRKIFMKKE